MEHVVWKLLARFKCSITYQVWLCILGNGQSTEKTLYSTVLYFRHCVISLCIYFYWINSIYHNAMKALVFTMTNLQQHHYYLSSSPVSQFSFISTFHFTTHFHVIGDACRQKQQIKCRCATYKLAENFFLPQHMMESKHLSSPHTDRESPSTVLHCLQWKVAHRPGSNSLASPSSRSMSMVLLNSMMCFLCRSTKSARGARFVLFVQAVTTYKKYF